MFNNSPTVVEQLFNDCSKFKVVQPGKNEIVLAQRRKEGAENRRVYSFCTRIISFNIFRRRHIEVSLKTVGEILMGIKTYHISDFRNV